MVCLQCALAPSASALTVSSAAPGNIFISGQPIDLAIEGAQGDVSYEVMDYFGNKIAEGHASAMIHLPGWKPGWYELTCKDASGSSSTPIGVVMDRRAASLPEDGRICVDVAAAWLLEGSAARPVARMVRMAGIPWVRERLSWTGTQKARGKFDWAQYPAVADAFAAEGVRICQLWHDSPEWTRPPDHTMCPEDLRDVYRFTRAAATRFSRQIQAWEAWNEEDSGFWPLLSDRYSGLLKAAYLGFKDGNPRAIVLQGSLCALGTQFQQDLYESGGADYFEIFNWHTYNPPSAYQGLLQSYLEPLRRYGISNRPIWMTEAGIHVPRSECPKNRLLNSGNQRRQCQFVPRSAVMSLAAGTDRNFFFVLPDYVEGVLQFGALHPDLTPYPSFLALSAAANILGQSEYRGEFEAGKGIVAHLFSTPKGNVLVAWSDTESEMTVPTEKNSVHAANIFGEESSLPSANGSVKVKVGPDAVYLLDIGKSVEKKLTGEPRPRGKLPRLKPSRVIVVGHANLPIDKAADCYALPGQEPFDYIVEVYNLSETATATGTVELVRPAGWTAEHAKRAISLGPMGRQLVTYRFKPGSPKRDRFKLTVRAEFGWDRVAPCISCFRFDPATFSPVSRKPLDWATNCARWKPEACAIGTVTLSNPDPESLRLDAAFKSEGDRWAYPSLRFDKPIDMSGFDAVAFDLNVRSGDPTSVIRLMLVEPNGAHYTAATNATEGQHRVVFLFRDMQRLDLMGPDPNGHLDVNAISGVKLGCNAYCNHLVFDASGFELVKF